jgi:membrane protease YdiL (CAAX protease family)
MPQPPRAAPWAVPLALAPMLLLSLADGLYKRPLYHWSAAAFWLADIAKFVLLPGIVLWWLARHADVRPRDYGLRWPRTQDERSALLGGTLLACLVLGPAYFVAQDWIWRAWPAAAPVFSYDTALPASGSARWLAIAYYATTAGVVEEIVFRGLPWAWTVRFGDTRAIRWIWIAVTSILFGLAHWENGTPDVLAAGVFGIGAAVLYLRLRSLWPLVLAHVVTDVIAFA